MNVTAAIITYNEEEMLPQCLTFLESLKNLTHINILDSFSTDRTVAIAKQFAFKSEKSYHIHQREFEGFHKQRNYQWDRCEDGWIIWIDADETYNQILDDAIPYFGATGYEVYDIVQVVTVVDKKHRRKEKGYQTRIFKKGSFSFVEEYPYRNIYDEKKRIVLDRIVFKDHALLKSDAALLEKGRRIKSLGLFENKDFEAYGFDEKRWLETKNIAATQEIFPLEKEYYDITTEAL